MTKLASEIVGIINSRNEYMEKQAGLSSFIAKKVVKPLSRFMFGKTDLAAAKARRYMQSKNLWENGHNAHRKAYEALVRDGDRLTGKFDKLLRDPNMSGTSEDLMKTPYFSTGYKNLKQRQNSLGQWGANLLRRNKDLEKMHKNLGGSSGIREAIDKANAARDNAYRFGRDLGILGSGSVIGGAVGRLTAPETPRKLPFTWDKYLQR